jgi:hypothetical protein
MVKVFPDVMEGIPLDLLPFKLCSSGEGFTVGDLFVMREGSNEIVDTEGCVGTIDVPRFCWGIGVEDYSTPVG